MAIYGLVEAGKVVDAQMHADAPGDAWVRMDNVAPQPGIGWSYDGAAFAPPPLASDNLAAYASRKQLALRDGGIKVDVGAPSAAHLVDVASDVDGRSLVSGCVQLIGLAAQSGQPAPSFPWVNDDGTAATLSAAQILTIGYRLGAFVQATYATLGAVLAGIAAGTIQTAAAVDAAAWPAASA